jgi:hypothetical protein
MAALSTQPPLELERPVDKARSMTIERAACPRHRFSADISIHPRIAAAGGLVLDPSAKTLG